MTIPKMSPGRPGDPETVLLIEESPDPDQNESISGPAPVVGPSLKKAKVTSSTASDFTLIKIVARLTLQMIRKFWALSSAAALAIILFYWLCGGFVAFGFVVFAISGKNELTSYFASWPLTFNFRLTVPCHRSISVSPRPTGFG